MLMTALFLSSCGDRSDQNAQNSGVEEVQEEVELEGAVTPETSPVIQPVTTPQQLPEGNVQLPEIDPLEVEGDISIAGSSTVFPISLAIYENFIQYGYAGKIKLDSIGSGAGFRLFCEEGESDISNASRPIKEEEVEACTAIGRQPIEFRIGTDALAIVVNPANEFITNVTKEELATIFTAEKWSDVNSDWPNEIIERFVPGEDSGTFDFFVEEVLDDNGQRLLNAPNTELSEDDNYIEQNVASNSNAIGFMGYAYYKQNANELKILSIEEIVPSPEVIENGDYIFSRPLLIYSDANVIRNKPQVGHFINFYLNNVNKIIEEVGYFPSSSQTLDASKNRLLEVME
ncbi:MAG: PstS family phosphate ABC transporter substrate-binding protein [Leptolyngbya sp. SIO1E4]|nr:PstS family phosphate ABC transporter substrate-binding protein [Leptolyngbya sp. SIO1E4]